MSINDPILKALSFTLENDLSISTPPASSSTAGAASNSRGDGEDDVGERDQTASSQSDSAFLKCSVALGEDKEILCVFQDCSYKIMDKAHQKELFTHLLNEHNLVIENADVIANLNSYLTYWRGMFSTAPISDFCVGFVMEEPPMPLTEVKRKNNPNISQDKNFAEARGTGECKATNSSSIASSTPQAVSKSTKNKMFYMLSPALPEDKQLRKELWKRRLDIILEVNREEREDNGFSRRCLFCRLVISGNRSQYFDHMRDSHSFHIGQPDNLVFVKEFLQLLEHKLNRLECLFCENLFKDKVILKEHMRKKQHRKINPKNLMYDKYYVVNYLEPGKTWETLQLEDAEDERKEDEWLEPTEDKGKTIVCLFCKKSESDFPKILSHMESAHNFKFTELTSSFDFYQKVKLVNYIRRSVYQNACPFCEARFKEAELLLQHMSSEHPIPLLPEGQWNRQEYFFPTYEDDDFLTSLGTTEEEEDDAEKRTRQVSVSSTESNVIPEDLPNLDMRNRDFDLAGFAIRFHNQTWKS